MVFPNDHRPTDSETRWNIAPGHDTTELAKNYKVAGCVSFVLRSVDRTCSMIDERFHISPNCRSGIDRAATDKQPLPGVAGHRSVDEKEICHDERTFS